MKELHCSRSMCMISDGVYLSFSAIRQINLHWKSRKVGNCSSAKLALQEDWECAFHLAWLQRRRKCDIYDKERKTSESSADSSIPRTSVKLGRRKPEVFLGNISGIPRTLHSPGLSGRPRNNHRNPVRRYDFWRVNPAELFAAHPRDAKRSTGAFFWRARGFRAAIQINFIDWRGERALKGPLGRLSGEPAPAPGEERKKGEEIEKLQDTKKKE